MLLVTIYIEVTLHIGRLNFSFFIRLTPAKNREAKLMPRKDGGHRGVNPINYYTMTEKMTFV
jgi:hypothetical protein